MDEQPEPANERKISRTGWTMGCQPSGPHGQCRGFGLQQQFPEYAAYAQRTQRFVPWVY
jgi:hypothetical protein